MSFVADKNYVPPLPQKKMQGFIKADSSKIDLSLFEPEVELSFCRAAEYGIKKYARGNWRKAKLEDIPRFYASMKRHENAELSGEQHDNESGLPHRDLALWNRGVLNYFINKFGHNEIFRLIRGEDICHQ